MKIYQLINGWQEVKDFPFIFNFSKQILFKIDDDWYKNGYLTYHIVKDIPVYVYVNENLQYKLDFQDNNERNSFLNKHYQFLIPFDNKAATLKAIRYVAAYEDHLQVPSYILYMWAERFASHEAYKNAYRQKCEENLYRLPNDLNLVCKILNTYSYWAICEGQIYKEKTNYV